MDTDLALEALVGHQSVAQLFGEKGLSPGRHFTYLHFSFPICKARVIMGPAPSGLSRGAEALIVEKLLASAYHQCVKLKNLLNTVNPTGQTGCPN
jgi:hypothetical protein